ncbi:hypothetical protein SAMN02745823_03421 [Sporobacter termitidis DSM 10068]|uniref:Glucosyl transferase GtrII n=1 Tax=Sporobacter termitidis DSM 10068 TaxID=1123282 RepID=A0A1M5Z9V3_9FIRM|nr:hypothetical protein [Sporobacter termitidis]SHI20908.1 hypothetical protein SAMN02745823_03421 [Sporobacter termitidis DSM 10068]
MERIRARYAESYLALFCVVFALIFIRYCCDGFRYFYQLDDYIQFHNLTVGGLDSLSDLLRAGMLADRPVAGILDVYFWSLFFDNMLLGVLLMSALYAASALMLRWVWARHFGVGNVFLVVYALLPLGLEGVYWMSAATRIVVGLFFAAAALLWFEKWCAGGKKYTLVLYMLLQLVACGFYEQILIFSVASVLIVAFLHRHAPGHRPLWGLFSFVSAGVYALLMGLLPASEVYAARISLVPPTSVYYWKTYLPGVLRQVADAFAAGGFYTTVKGFYRGAQILAGGRNIFYIIDIAVLAALLFFSTRHGEGPLKAPGKGLIAGLLLAAAPLAIFFFISNSWLSLRGTVASYCGIALMADIACRLIFSRLKSAGTAVAGVAAALAVIFSVAAVSEVHDYKATTQKDQEVAAVLTGTLKKDGNLHRDLNVGILHLEPSYLDDQNYYYHEHIHGVTESDWALHGALEWLAGPNIPDVAPLPENPMYFPWNCASRRLSNFDVLYLYDGDETMTQVLAVPAAAETYALYEPDGTYLGYTWEEGGYGYLELGEPLP